MTKDTAEQICKQAHCSGVLKFSESKQVDSSAVHCPLHSHDLFQCQGLLQETECTTVNVTCEGSKPKLVYRLANGPSECVGKVMVYHQNKWEKVCNDSKLSANDICRSLNCGGIKEIQNAPPSKRKQQGMYCSISNTNLDDCFHSLTTKDCSMDWIICTEGPVCKHEQLIQMSSHFAALERALVNLNTGASSSRNSGYDYEPRAC
ncbi:DMBT1 protein, partial [Polypterus senegalus]|nr:DMBT1 protein [Polypterus senegalus]